MAASAAPNENLHENKCDKHEEDKLFLCVVCKCYICRTCVSEPDHDHKLSDIIQEQRKKFTDRIEKVEIEIKSVDVKLKQNSDACDPLLRELRSKTEDFEKFKSAINKPLNNYKTELNNQHDELKERLQTYRKTSSSGSDILIHNIDIPPLLVPPPLIMPQINFDDHRKALSELTIPGFRKCGKRDCNICPHNETETSHYFKSENDGNMYPIEHSLSCTSANVIYLVTCVKCQKQYVGETSTELHIRIAAHTQPSQKSSVGDHFRIEDHSWENDMKVIAIDTISDDKERLKIETSWMKKLQTKTPDGLNKKYSYTPRTLKVPKVLYKCIQ